jgi:hypothetical protein
MRSVGVDRSLRNLTGDWLRRAEERFVGVGGAGGKPSLLQSYTVLDRLSSLSSRLTLWRRGSYLLLKILRFSLPSRTGLDRNLSPSSPSLVRFSKFGSRR